MTAVNKKVTDQDAAAAVLRPYFRRAAKKPDPKQNADASPDTVADTGSSSSSDSNANAAAEQPEASTDSGLTLPTPIREWAATDGATFDGSLVRFLDEDFQKA